ncbi:MAG TPA: alpha/beta hydrolase [Caulobacteraceae bacterium]|nr:alpha/beta hydrolase [Caulobacteraceae bacterium]
MAPPSVIFAHGAFCGGWAFERFRGPFEARGLACLAPDMRGHGAGSPRDATAGLSMADYAADLAMLVAEQAEPPILIGHSLGGLVAQMAAARAPVRALVLLAPSPPWGVPGGSLGEAISAISLYGLGAFWMQAIEPDYGSARGYSLDRLSSPERHAIFERMAPESGRALWETLNWWLDPMTTTQVTPSAIEAPVLALSGERDAIHPPSTVSQITERLGGDFRVLKDMSHWLVAEPGWDAAARMCLDWLAAKGALES